MTTTLYLVRHGETDLNVAERCQGSLDVPMNATGEAQVTSLAEQLSHVHFDAAYTSPLLRASRSARILLGSRTTPLTELQALSELSYGAWQGTSYVEWPDRAAERWKTDPHSMAFPEGETLYAVRERAWPALQEIIYQHPDQTLLVTAHGHLNRVLLMAMLGQPALQFWDIAQPNCAAWKISCDVSDDTITLLSARVIGERITRETAQRAMDAKTKPLGALGHLENCAVRLSVLQQSLRPELRVSRVCVFAADHGVSDEGVSAYPPAVTAEMMKNFGAGGAAINALAMANDVQVEVLDVGVDAEIDFVSNIRHEKVRRSSRNFMREPAMTADELTQAMTVGANALKRAVREGVQAVGLGEMGIGNSTSAAALLGALTGCDALETVGLGTGVSEETLSVKRAVVTRATELHEMKSERVSARECLRRVGGLELAAIAGAALESVHHSVAIVADGFISTVAILSAAFIAHEETRCGAAVLGERIFFAHQSSERGHRLAIQSFNKLCGTEQRPLLDLEMRLGE
ncbi:MAG: nicotinate-nucleotide--dimethylbenzimidazole phosphoribosyltransferase, partial [Gemmatimonadaceae bacterium]